MKHEQFDSWDEFDVEVPIQQASVPAPIPTAGAEVSTPEPEPAPVAPLPKSRGGRRKKQVETPVEITEEVEPVEENTTKEV